MERTEAAALLGVSSTASHRQVRAAFRKRVRSDHPDRNSKSTTDFHRLVEARDLLLTPAPEPELEPEQIVAPEPTRPTPPKPTLTYGYDPNKGDRVEEYISRPPSASLGTQQAPPGLIGRLRRLGWQILAMGALSLLFFQLVLRGLMFPASTCVGSSSTGPIEVACTSRSDLEIETIFDDINARCPGLSEPLRVGSQLWCVVPYDG